MVLFLIASPPPFPVPSLSLKVTLGTETVLLPRVRRVRVSLRPIFTAQFGRRRPKLPGILVNICPFPGPVLVFATGDRELNSYDPVTPVANRRQ